MPPPNKKQDGNPGRFLGLALVIPISTMVGYGMGYGLDRLFGTEWLRIVFLILGTAAGIFEMIYEADKG